MYTNDINNTDYNLKKHVIIWVVSHSQPRSDSGSLCDSGKRCIRPRIVDKFLLTTALWSETDTARGCLKMSYSFKQCISSVSTVGVSNKMAPIIVYKGLWHSIQSLHTTLRCHSAVIVLRVSTTLFTNWQSGRTLTEIVRSYSLATVSNYKMIYVVVVATYIFTECIQQLFQKNITQNIYYP